jgi:hypothetical protein
MTKILSLKETKKDIIKMLELPPNEFAITEVMEEEKSLMVEFKFNMRYAISNPTFFRQVAAVMTKYQAHLSLEPREKKGADTFIELSVRMKADEIKP